MLLSTKNHLNINLIRIINEYNMINNNDVILNKQQCLKDLEKQTIILKYHLTFPFDKNDIIKRNKKLFWYVSTVC